jgi:hypothetical protein
VLTAKVRAGVRPNLRELTIIALLSLFSLGLAWAYEANLFAMFFAAAAAIAGIERFDDLCDAFLYARMFAGQVRAGGLAQRSQQRGCVVRASKEARWTTLVPRWPAAPVHRLGKSAPSSGPSFSCRLPSLR